MGRPKTPTRIKQLTGNPGRRPLTPELEPQASRGLPPCPKRLQGAARDTWDFIATELRAMQMDHRIDALALEGACVAFQRATEADEALRKNGTTFLTPNGYCQARPEVAISSTNWKAYRAFCSEFGLTPSGRSRLHMKAPEPKKVNKFSQFSQIPPAYLGGDDDE